MSEQPWAAGTKQAESRYTTPGHKEVLVVSQPLHSAKCNGSDLPAFTSTLHFSHIASKRLFQSESDSGREQPCDKLSFQTGQHHIKQPTFLQDLAAYTFSQAEPEKL